MDPLRPPASLALIEALALLRPEKRASGRERTNPQGAGKAIAVRDQLREIVAAMEPDNPMSYETARSGMLKCILASQWGEGHEADPLYGEVLAALERDFRDNERLADLFRNAIEGLRASR